MMIGSGGELSIRTFGFYGDTRMAAEPPRSKSGLRVELSLK